MEYQLFRHHVRVGERGQHHCDQYCRRLHRLGHRNLHKRQSQPKQCELYGGVRRQLYDFSERGERESVLDRRIAELHRRIVDIHHRFRRYCLFEHHSDSGFGHRHMAVEFDHHAGQ